MLGEAGAFAGQRPRAVVGRDPRVSGEFLEAAVVAGLASAGVDVHRLGVLPTPGVAFLTAALDADMGVMISASHNPMPDNGIKFLSRGGHKLDDDIEHAIESRLEEPWDRPTGAEVGRITTYDAAVSDYVEHLRSTRSGAAGRPHGRPRLRERRGVRGGARGASRGRRRGGRDPRRARRATTSTTAAAPRTSSDLQKAVLEHGADAGFAFDGDADRCLAVDAEGNVVDGDQILAILALALRDAGALVDDTVVATVMSNLGFVQAMERRRHHGRADQGRRPLRPRGDERPGFVLGRRAVRPRHHERLRHHRRRRRSPRCRCSAGWRPPAGRSPTSPPS